MDAAALRQMQAPIKERYKTDPKTAMITLKAKGSTDSEGIACKVAPATCCSRRWSPAPGSR